MQKWEYLEIDVYLNDWLDSLGRPGTLSQGNVAPDRGAVNMFIAAGLLNELGEQGWELAGVAGSQSVEHYKLLLKRPRL